MKKMHSIVNTSTKYSRREFAWGYSECFARSWTKLGWEHPQPQPAFLLIYFVPWRHIPGVLDRVQVGFVLLFCIKEYNDCWSSIRYTTYIFIYIKLYFLDRSNKKSYSILQFKTNLQITVLMLMKTISDIFI